MRKFFLPLIALVAGFCLAFLAAIVSNYFFVLLPILAFAFGYFSSRGLGLLCSLLLFGGYTLWWGIDNSNLLYPLSYIRAFTDGGLGILLIGVLSSIVRKGIKGADSIVVLVILAGMVGLCVFNVMPQDGYYYEYEIAIQSSENLNNLELYLPMGTVSGKSYGALLNQVYSMPGNLTHEVVDTEQGKMLKITIPELKKNTEQGGVLIIPVPLVRKDYVPEPYMADIILRQENVPRELIRLMPRYDVERVNMVTSQRMRWPIKSSESLIVERFDIPIKIMASSQAPIKLAFWNRTEWNEAVNFAYSRSYTYTEVVNWDLTTGEEWVFVPVEAARYMNISGISD